MVNAIVAGTSTLLVWIVLTRFMARRKRPGHGLGLVLFFLAGAASVVPGLALYSLSPLWFPPEIQDSRFGRTLFFWLVNAPIEEVVKWAAFALVATIGRWIREPQDGALWGAATGLGFAVVENCIYGAGGDVYLIFLRALVSLPGHVIYGAVWGGYFGFEWYQNGGRIRRWSNVLLALVPAVFSHALFNTLVEYDAPLGANLLVDSATLALGVILFRQLDALSPFRRKYPWKDWKKAVAELELAVVHHPDSVVLRQRWAAYLLSAGKTAQALRVLEECDRLQKDDAWTLFYRSVAHSLENDSTNARSLWERMERNVGTSESNRRKPLYETLVQRGRQNRGEGVDSKV